MLQNGLFKAAYHDIWHVDNPITTSKLLLKHPRHTPGTHGMDGSRCIRGCHTEISCDALSPHLNLKRMTCTLGVRVYFVRTRRRCVVFAFLSGLHFLRIPLTHPQPALHPQPHSPMHPPLLWQTPHHPYPALHSLTPPNRLFTHLTPASSSLPPLQPHPYNELTRRFARVTGHHQARFWSSKLTGEPK